MNFTKDELLKAIIENIREGKAELSWSEDMLAITILLNGEEVRVRSDDVWANYHVYNAGHYDFSEYYFHDVSNFYLENESGVLNQSIGFSKEDESDIRNVVNDSRPTSYYIDDGREADGYIGSELVFDPYAEGISPEE